MLEVFVAYASGNDFHGGMIGKVAAEASSNLRKILPWSDRDTSGFPISESVEAWIARADSFVADISIVNPNVTYEVGYALGLGKPVRLMRSQHISFQQTKDIGLLDTLGHDSYSLESSLLKVFQKDEESSKWPEVPKNGSQPIFILQPPNPNDLSLRVTSAIKKIARLRFKSFNPWEISRLNASEAYEQATAAYGVVAFWSEGTDVESVRNNQRAAFIYGIARGRNIPSLLIAHDSVRLPLDLQDHATRWSIYSDIDPLIANFRDNVAELQFEFVQVRTQSQNLLTRISCGDPTAENEATDLAEYFLETEGYQRALNGEAHVFVGRKGSGKTAVFLQARDRTRAVKDNIVIDLMPDGYQLIKMKEFILDQLGFGARKEFIAAFWQYVLWLEITYKLLEKDQHRAYRDSALLAKYKKLEELFNERVDTGAGDFSERLKLLSQRIVERFESAKENGVDTKFLDSSKVLEIVYAQDVHKLREAVTQYLKIKGFVFFLIDNLDRFWTPGGFTNDDALIVIGLIEAMQEITRRFRREKLDFRWAIFVRSDVYEFLIRGMADYGKLSTQSLEWLDRDLLKILFERRVMSGILDLKLPWREAWSRISVATVDGKPTVSFLIDGSIMRPRYLIRLFETARRRAITFGRKVIHEEDYLAALKELGWQVVEDIDREISDLIPDGTDLLFEVLQAGKELTAEKFRYIVGKRLSDEKMISKLLDVMLWNGSLGVMEGNSAKYIYDCGYKRQYLAALIDADKSIKLDLHPTLVAALS